jgi:hypothetical protein
MTEAGHKLWKFEKSLDTNCREFSISQMMDGVCDYSSQLSNPRNSCIQLLVLKLSGVNRL